MSPFVLSALETLRWWVPLVSVSVLVWKAYADAKKSVREWADKLFENHLAHIQAASEQGAASLQRLVEYQHDSAVAVQKVAVDLEAHEQQDARVQAEILSGIEVLKNNWIIAAVPKAGGCRGHGLIPPY